MDFYCDSAGEDIPEDLNKWCARDSVLQEIANIIFFIGTIVISLCSLSTFVLVACKRKVRDKHFIVLIVSLFLASVFFSIRGYALVIEHRELETFGTPRIIVNSLGMSCYVLAYWAFSSKYIETSYVLPSVLNRASIDFRKKGSISDSIEADQLERSYVRL